MSDYWRFPKQKKKISSYSRQENKLIVFPMMRLKNSRSRPMAGYQDFVNIFSSGKFVTSSEIAKKFSFQKALSSVYIIPTFFRGVVLHSPHLVNGKAISLKTNKISSQISFIAGMTGRSGIGL
jgi:hypothetical protein